jgi:hypothetical protein
MALIGRVMKLIKPDERVRVATDGSVVAYVMLRHWFVDGTLIYRGASILSENTPETNGLPVIWSEAHRSYGRTFAEAAGVARAWVAYRLPGLQVD